MKAEIGDKWFRVEDYYGSGNELQPYERILYVVKVTPAGVRLCEQPTPQWYHRPKFVLYPEQPYGCAMENIDNGGRRFAYPTIRMARWSWLYRKRKQLDKCRAKAQQLEDMLAASKERGDDFWDVSVSRAYVLQELERLV